MILKPFDEDENQVDTVDELPKHLDIATIDVKAIQRSVEQELEIGGGQTGKKSQKAELDEIRDLFTQHGASLEDIAKMTGQVMRNADEASLRLKAGEMALKVYGIFKDIDDRQIPQVTINIVGDGNNTMVNLLCPNP